MWVSRVLGGMGVFVYNPDFARLGDERPSFNTELV
jgi:hypothetical protein